jgi:hypothetical protein
MICVAPSQSELVSPKLGLDNLHNYRSQMSFPFASQENYHKLDAALGVRQIWLVQFREKLDFHKEPERCIKVVASYGLITNVKLGLNTSIKPN